MPAVSAQQASQQLGHASQPLVRRMQRKLGLMATYDASLSSWQDLYRCVSWLDFGSGLATGITALQRVSSKASAEAPMMLISTSLHGGCKPRMLLSDQGLHVLQHCMTKLL